MSVKVIIARAPLNRAGSTVDWGSRVGEGSTPPVMFRYTRLGACRRCASRIATIGSGEATPCMTVSPSSSSRAITTAMSVQGSCTTEAA